MKFTGLRIAGMTPVTSIDFPGKLAAVVFLQGCSWNCGYCHNPELQPADQPCAMTWEYVRAFLLRRRGLLDAVVFSGGEPTLQAGLEHAVLQVRELGFAVGLHTAGMYPDRLAKMLPLLDWVGLDIKGPCAEYDSITGAPGSGERARESLAHVLRSGVEYECRTTWHEGLFATARLHALAQELGAAGARYWALQACLVDGQAQPSPPAGDLARMGRHFGTFRLR
jgi:pyruvate formate lyase activating enzyme